MIPQAASTAATATYGQIFPTLAMATQASSLRQQQERSQERKDQSKSLSKSMAAMNQTTSDIQKTLFDAFQEAQKSHYLANPDEKTKPPDAKKNVKLAQRSQTPPTKGEQQTKWLSETMPLVESLVPAFATRYTEEETPPTPTYTSKSFDDLHRLLGENIPELTTNFDESKVGIRMRIRGQSKKIDGQATKAANELAMESTNPSTAIKSDKTTTVTYHQRINLNEKKESTSKETTENTASNPVFLSPCDEYAFLAQQSAIEASKHSAYYEQPLKRSATPIVIDNKKKKTSHGTQPLLLLGEIGAALLSKKNIKLHSKSHERMTNGSSQNQDATVVSVSEPSSSTVNSRVDSLTSSGTDDHSDSASSEGKSFSSSRDKRRVDNDSGLEKIKKIKVEKEEEGPISMQ